MGVNPLDVSARPVTAAVRPAVSTPFTVSASPDQHDLARATAVAAPLPGTGIALEDWHMTIVNQELLWRLCHTSQAQSPTVAPAAFAPTPSFAGAARAAEPGASRKRCGKPRTEPPSLGRG